MKVIMGVDGGSPYDRNDVEPDIIEPFIPIKKIDIMSITDLLNHLVLIEKAQWEDTKYGKQLAIYGKMFLYDKPIKIFTTSKLIIQQLRSIYKKFPIVGSFISKTAKAGHTYYMLDTPALLNKQGNDITFEDIRRRINTI